MPDLELKELVKKRYGDVAQGAAGCGSLCGCVENAEQLAVSFGYTQQDLANLPPGTNLGLSCGNPQALAALRPGETVLDLGSGAGFDVILITRRAEVASDARLRTRVCFVVIAIRRSHVSQLACGLRG